MYPNSKSILSSLTFAHEIYLYRCNLIVLAVCDRCMGLRSGWPELSDAICLNPVTEAATSHSAPSPGNRKQYAHRYVLVLANEQFGERQVHLHQIRDKVISRSLREGSDHAYTD